MAAQKGSASEDEGEPTSQTLLERLFSEDWRWTLTGGAIALVVTFGGAWAVGETSGAEARALLNGMLPTTRFLCSGVMTASATTLALMLTLLSLSANANSKLKQDHYERVRQIALLDTVAFIAATIVLLCLNIPVEQADNVAASWYDVLYYAFLGASAVLGGLLVVIVLMLYNTVKYMILIVGPADTDELDFVEAQTEDELG
ncbi:MAG: hypothetical protein ABJF88_04710 [Rhodothermales bacterium]